jgi:hypothetical protein
LLSTQFWNWYYICTLKGLRNNVTGKNAKTPNYLLLGINILTIFLDLLFYHCKYKKSKRNLILLLSRGKFLQCTYIP